MASSSFTHVIASEAILFAVALGIIMPVITMPLWPISKIMGGSDTETKGKIKEITEAVQKMTDD